MNEGGSFGMVCEASGDLKPNVYWIEVHNGQRINGSTLNLTNINRNDAGQYRCETENGCGSDSRVRFVDVYCKNYLKYVIRMFVYCQECNGHKCRIV